MNPTILIFFCGLSTISGFPTGRIDSNKQSNAPLFTVKDAFEVLQLFMMSDPEYQRHLLNYKNNSVIIKDDLTTREDTTTEAPVRLTLLEEMLNMTATEMISQANSGGMEKIIQRFEEAWGNGSYLDSYALKFRSFPDVSPSDVDVHFLP